MGRCLAEGEGTGQGVGAVVMTVMMVRIPMVLMMGLVAATNDSDDKILNFHGPVMELNAAALYMQSHEFDPQPTFLQNGRKGVRKGKPSEWVVAQLVECLSSMQET